MKKSAFILFLLLSITNISFSQKYAFVDVQTILEKMPEYKEAQKELDDLAEKFQKEIEGKYAEIDKKNKAYQQEQILLPEETKTQREQELQQLSNDARQLQQKYFGPNGLLFKKRKELIEPIQDKIYKAIKQLANEKGYDFIMDDKNNSNILFVNPKYDKTNAILKKLGL